MLCFTTTSVSFGKHIVEVETSCGEIAYTDVAEQHLRTPLNKS